MLSSHSQYIPMEDFTIYCSICILLVIFTLTMLQKRRRDVNLPPSPMGLPIIGHLHLLKPPLHRSLHRLSLKHGPVLSLRFGSNRVVVVSSPSAVQECFTKNDVVFANRPHTLASKHLSYNNTTVINSSYGDHWRHLRRITTLEIFSPNRLIASVGVRRDEIRRLLRTLSRNPREDGYARVDLKSALSEMTFNMMMMMVAGKRCSGDDAGSAQGPLKRREVEAREMLREALEKSGVSNPSEFVPLLRWIEPGLENGLIGLGKKADRFWQGLIDENRFDKSEDTMIGHLLSLQESQPESYSDQIIKGIIFSMFVAGTDTSSVTLEWIMSNLLNNPHILNKARAELDTILGQTNLIDESDIANLPYLRNIISETLRLYPAAPLLVPHMSSEDCTVGGYDVPRGSTLLVNAWAIHRDPKLWNDPESFRPERFDNVYSKEPLKLMPFGIGRRACPGVGLAGRVVSLTLGSLIQGFEWERVGGEKIDMSEGKGVTMPKVVPLEALCKPRPVMEKFLQLRQI